MKDSLQPSRWIVLMAAVVAAGLSANVSEAQQSGQRGRRANELEELMQNQPGQAPALFGATVSRVRVDVIVTDAEGNFVADLRAEDFAVFEDGERQEIVNIQLVDLGAGQVASLRPGEAAPTAELAGQTPPADAGERNAASDLGAVIFLIDAPSLNQQAKARFGDAWAHLLDQTDALQVPRAAYMFNNYGRVDELAPLGYDLETIRTAAETVRDAPFFGTSMRTRMFEIAADLSNTDSTPDGDIARQIAAAKARGFEVEERSRSLATYELLTNFADALWSRPGRTAVVWVSTGIKLMRGGPYTALVAFDPRLTEVPEGDPAAVDEGLAGARFDLSSPDAGIKAAQERLHRAANAANVSFYTIDPTLLAETRRVGSNIEVNNADAAGLLSTPAVDQSLDGLRDSMRLAAADTGGRAYIQDTDISMALAEIESDTSRFYLVSYEPPEASGDGEYHEIAVELLRDGLDVRARGGYVDYPAEDRARRSIEVALALPGLAVDLPIDAEAYRSRPAAGEPNVLTAVAVDAGELGLAVGADGEDYVSIDVHTAVLGEDEIVDEAHEQLTARSAAGGLQVSGDNNLAPSLVGFLAYRREWMMPPGQYTLNIAVLDNVTGRVGATTIDVEIVEATEPWSVSDPLLVTVDDAGRGQPAVLGRVLEGQGLAAFVEVFGGVQPVLSGQVFLEQDDGGDPEQGARLFPAAMRPAGPGLHHGTLLLPPALPPGRYFVRLQITDGAVLRDEVVRLPLEVVERAGR